MEASRLWLDEGAGRLPQEIEEASLFRLGRVRVFPEVKFFRTVSESTDYSP